VTLATINRSCLRSRLRCVGVPQNYPLEERNRSKPLQVARRAVEIPSSGIFAVRDNREPSARGRHRSRAGTALRKVACPLAANCRAAGGHSQTTPNGRAAGARALAGLLPNAESLSDSECAFERFSLGNVVFSRRCRRPRARLHRALSFRHEAAYGKDGKLRHHPGREFLSLARPQAANLPLNLGYVHEADGKPAGG
jgi:hypothetical protein